MTDIKKLRSQLRTAIADYMWSEGCSCCQGDDHDTHKEIIGRLLNVPKYSDGSGRDFSIYRSGKQVIND